MSAEAAQTTKVVMGSVIEFTLPGLPKTTNGNARRHWRALHAEATKWKRYVSYSVLADIPNEPFAKAKLTLTRHSSNEPDFDGLVSSFKHVIDGLVDVGVLANDKMSTIGQPEYRWEYAPPKAGFITVRVECA